MMMAKLRPELTQWLNDGVYPHLSHTQIFGDLVGFTVANPGPAGMRMAPGADGKAVFTGCRGVRWVNANRAGEPLAGSDTCGFKSTGMRTGPSHGLPNSRGLTPDRMGNP